MSTTSGGSIWRRLPVEQIEDEVEGGGRLAKSLGLWQLTAIGVGGIIGSASSPSPAWWPTATPRTPASARRC